MSNAHQILIVGAVDCNDQVSTFMVSWSLGKPAKVAAEYGGIGIDVAKVGTVDLSGNVEAHFVVQVRGTSVDAVTSTVAAISAELAALSPITVGLKNSAYVGTLIPKIAECIEIPQEAPWDSRLVNANATLIEIVVRREPFVYDPAELLHSAAGFDAPCLVPLSAQTGQFATPQDLLLDAGALDLAACYVAHTDDATAVIGDFVHKASDFTWSGGAAVADAGGYPDGVGNTSRYCSSTDEIYGDVDVSAYKRGEYAVFANCAVNTTPNGAMIRHDFCDYVPIPWTTLHLLPLGVVYLPSHTVRSGSSAANNFRVYIKGGPEYVHFNHVALLPVSRGLIGWQETTWHAHRLLWADGTMYVEDVVKLGEVFGNSTPLRTLKGQLIVLAEQVTPAPTTHLHVTASSTPRWEQFPSL